MRFACVVERFTVKPNGAVAVSNRGFFHHRRRAAMRLALGVVFLSAPAVADPTEQRPSDTISFERDVRPILQKCIGCHGPERPKADLCLTRPGSAIESAAIVPGDPNGSALIIRVTSTDPDERMPPDSPLSAAETVTLRHWIEQGASWPEHWAYSKLARPQLPRTAGLPMDWVQTPVDQFIAAKLTERNLTPSPPADRHTLLRRVYYDLLGLPPSKKAIVAFENDDQPDAFERVVDQLLASPQYGERWARHWMDVVHFAETHGHDQDRPREHAWPFRDYLISRFNDDVPYSRFVKEQIAGDVISPDDPMAMVGTGLLASGPWDESSLRDIQENSVDREIGRYLDRDDIVTTVMSTFASTSVHCARCHHHKFDPISQDDYYGLQAIFAGIDKANRAFDTDPHIANKRQHLRDALKQLATWSQEKNAQLLSDGLQTRADRWESHIASQLINWSPVEFAEYSSSGGATMTLQDDNSIFVEGRRPDTDTYTIELRTPIENLRAVRLSVLADERLPMNGPGRQSNGNLHLNEVRIFQVDPSSEERTQRMRITDAVADFNQADWGVEKAVDGKFESAWGIFPEVGKSHHAVFQLAERAKSSDAGTQLRIELDQVHGSGHLIGRFAIHVTRDGGPYLDELHLPEDVATILSTTDRSREDRMVLAAYVERQRLQSELAALPTPSYVYCGTNRFEPDGSFRPTEHPREVHVLDRGEIKKPLRLASPAVLHCIEGLSLDANDSRSLLSDNESDRRKALASWLADRRNGLVWRSIANRVWHYHFGKPIVDTPNDFGLAGFDSLAPATARLACGNVTGTRRFTESSASHHRDQCNLSSVVCASRRGVAN